MTRALLSASVLLVASMAGACSAAGDSAEADDDAITSRDGRILDFTFKGEVIATEGTQARTAILTQLAYTQGILTSAEGANGHVGHVALTDLVESPPVEGKTTIRYTAHLPVAWPNYRYGIPSQYAFPLPKDVTARGIEDFNGKYDGACGRNRYGRATFWHDFDPRTCTLAEGDVTRSIATVTPFAGETTGKYPEYDLIWKDGELDVVAIFGLISGVETPSDWGVREYNTFIAGSRQLLKGSTATNNAATDSVLRDTTVTGTVTVAGRSRPVKIDVLLVNELQYVGPDFDDRYDPLSEKADLILYNGHAGLGKNVNALGRKGKVVAGKYQLVLLNGCQSFAYMDTTMNERRTEANGAAIDPQGTKFMDVIGNALPGSSDELASVSLPLVSAAVNADTPKTYYQIMDQFPQASLVVAFGEEDNQFTPSK